ncbi:MAG: LysR family transcriptional regulator [Kordiimonadaceae bacterium]|nr:LysR family transcriptional regulator [Kordiimonadaceae bacterium]
MKRKLPALATLECFEAVIHHGLVTRAAEELNLTQSAVSRQISNLEAYVQQPLFVRRRKRLMPTDAALRYLRSVSPLLDTLETETLRLMSSSTENQVLMLGLLPTFGSRWLMPRLGGFTEGHHDIQLNILTGLTFEDFKRANVDVAIAYGNGNFAGYQSFHLMNETIQPVISPDHYANPDVLSYEHLQMSTRPSAWPDWLAAQKIDAKPSKIGPTMGHFTMMIEAVRSGLGVAVLPSMYVKDDLKAGRLLAPFGPAVTSRNGYYLISPDHLASSKKVAAFKDWLLTETQKKKAD